MSRYISRDLRLLVITRAGFICEYCLIHEDEAHYSCQVDHITSVKHGGPTTAENLAYACLLCNRNKGSDAGAISPLTGQIARFFNPRTDRWAEHFRLDGPVIKPLTDIGEVTARIFGFNDPKRVEERRISIEAGDYPSAAAMQRMI
jgi:hypothetical protein